MLDLRGTVRTRTVIAAGANTLEFSLGASNEYLRSCCQHNNYLYEPEIMHVLCNYLRPGDICIDAGAAHGYHTLLMSRLVGASGEVLAFEPDPWSLRKLEDNLKFNGAANVRALADALWQEPATLRFFAAEPDNYRGYSGIIQYTNVVQRVLEITAAPLDLLINPESHIRLLKIDCEGSETQILYGAEKLLRRGVDYVIVEFNYKIMPLVGTTEQKIRDYMRSLGYDLFVIFKDGTKPLYIAPEVRIEVTEERVLFNGMFAKRGQVERWSAAKLEGVFNPAAEQAAYAALMQSGVTPREALVDWMFEQTKGVVQSGPFKGMQLNKASAWADGALCPMLLGCHEQELWGPIEEGIGRLEKIERPWVLNVGCAEGYYAVGLKRRLPQAAVWATDLAKNALAVTVETAALNGVELITRYDPREALEVGPDLIVMDCEGGELGYLNPYTFPALLRSSIIVEIHQSEEQDTGGVLVQHWHHSHDIYLVWEGGRNPNDYDVLKEHTSLLRWMAVSENRPCQMAWFVMRPKDANKGDKQRCG